MGGNAGDWRHPAVGDQPHAYPLTGGGFGEADDFGLIAADVEDDQHILRSHADELVQPVALLPGHMLHTGTHDAQMRGHVTGERIGEAPADDVNRPLFVGEQPDEGFDVLLRQMQECLAQVLDQLVGKGIAAARACFRQCRVAGKRRFQLVLKFRTQPLLKIGKAGKTKPCNKTQDRRRTDTGSFRELGDRLQTQHRIIGQQRHRRPPFGGGELVQPLPDFLGQCAFHGLFPVLSAA